MRTAFARRLAILHRASRVPLPPFARGQPEPLLEHRVEQAEMPVAAVVGDVDDFGVRVREQLLRALQAQLDLPRPQRHPKLRAEQAAEMPLAAMQPRRQFAQRTSRQIHLQHLPDDLAKAVAQFVRAGSRGRRRRKQAGHRAHP